jgi:glycosyltransferase involved in cell wall biosynthesis
VVIPAHNEELLIGACLDALATAMHHPDLAGIDTRVLVVADRCTDGTVAHCVSRGVPVLSVDVGNVGLARRTGFEALAGALPSSEDESVWLATSDADSRVPPHWLAEQAALADAGSDAVFGVVDLDGSGPDIDITDVQFTNSYPGASANCSRPHPYVHGANMGLRLAAYRRVGGIPGLEVGEDQALSDLLAVEPGINVARTTRLRVTTSARRQSRVTGGFADYLHRLAVGGPSRSAPMEVIS